MVDLIDSGKLTVASATAFSLSPEYAEKMNDKASFYRTKIVLRPQVVVSNDSDPQVALRLHEDAHEECFIANSVNFPVRHAPVVDVLSV